MYNLTIINSTVRPGRKGIDVAKWVLKEAEKCRLFNCTFADLADINLPLMDERFHPRLQKYEHEHTKQWSELIKNSDAFVFVTAEYDYNYPAPLRNALEYLFNEWSYKAAGLVSYGGISAGTRAVNALKADLSTFKLVPIMDMVNFPFFEKLFDSDGNFKPEEISAKAAAKMFSEINRWTKGLKIIMEDR